MMKAGDSDCGPEGQGLLVLVGDEYNFTADRLAKMKPVDDHPE
jgi:hypothetical protein